MREACATEGCPNLSEKRSVWCRTCLWRRQHGKPMTAHRRHRKGVSRTPEELLRDAARALASTEDTETPWWRLPEWNRLRTAAQRYLRANGWKPPRKPRSGRRVGRPAHTLVRP